MHSSVADKQTIAANEIRKLSNESGENSYYNDSLSHLMLCSVSVQADSYAPYVEGLLPAIKAPLDIQSTIVAQFACQTKWRQCARGRWHNQLTNCYFSCPAAGTCLLTYPSHLELVTTTNLSNSGGYWAVSCCGRLTYLQPPHPYHSIIIIDGEHCRRRRRWLARRVKMTIGR